MHYYGTTKVALHGPVSSLLELAELLKEKAGGDSIEAQYAKDFLEDFPLKHLASLSSKSPKTFYLDNTFETDLSVLDFFEGIAQEKPELEIAIAAEVSISTTDTTGYCSYYSAAGEKTIHPNEFDDFCNEELHILMTAITYKGEKVKFDFADIENINNASIGSWGLFSMSEDEYDEYFNYGEELIPIILCLDDEGNWSWSDIEDPESDECEILDEEYGHYMKYPCNETLTFSGYDEGWEKLPSEFFLRVMKVMQPDLDIQAQRKDDRIHLLDKNGNEYFFPRMLHVDEIKLDIDWGFPKEATWIPF